MLKPLHLYFILLLASTLLFTGCDDDEVAPTRTDMLSAGSWTGFAVYFNGADITEELKEEHDFDVEKYTLKFEKTGAFTEYYAERKYEGKWEFRNEEQEILYDKGTAMESVSKITKLDAKELYLADELEYEGKPATFEFRYKQ